MEKKYYYIGIAFLGMINGIPFFNAPLYVLTFGYSIKLMAEPLFGNVNLIAYFASLMLSTATIIIGGIPAAIYERFAGITGDSTSTSLWIWLTGTGILAIPALGNFLRLGL